MKNDDIRKLLIHTSGEVEKISSQANSGDICEISLKNTLENMRSVLDYLARDIALYLKKSNPKTKEKVFFPYGQRKNHFDTSIKKSFPTLKQNHPDIYNIIESIQPFITNNQWLYDLCNLTNDTKHNFLSKTESSQSATVTQPGLGSFSGTNITLSNNTVNGVRQDDVYINEKGEASVTKYSGNTIITHNNHIKFHGKNIQIAPFLELCHKQIEKLTTDVWAILTAKA